MNIQEAKDNIREGEKWLKEHGFYIECVNCHTDDPDGHFDGAVWQLPASDDWWTSDIVEIDAPDDEDLLLLEGKIDIKDRGEQGYNLWRCYVNFDEVVGVDYSDRDFVVAYGMKPAEALVAALAGYDKEMDRRRKERFGAILEMDEK